MILPKGVIIKAKNGKTYQGEIPDSLVSEKSKKVIENHNNRLVSGKKKVADFNRKQKEQDEKKRLKKDADKKSIQDASNPSTIAEIKKDIKPSETSNKK